MSNKEKFLFISIALFFSIIFGVFFLFKYNLVEVERVDDAQAMLKTYGDKTNSSTTLDNLSTDSKNASSSAEIETKIIEAQKLALEIQKGIEENILARTAALAKADNAKGVYVSGYVGSSPNSSLFKNIKKLLAETELNAIVIDVKESSGPYMPDSMKKVIVDLHKDNVWVIARVCVFRDSFLIKEKPEWYLKYNNATDTATTSELWKDASGGYWLDPANPDVQDYIIDFSKKVIDFGFDELQFDYIRFPSDGSVSKIVYPYYDKEKSKFEIMDNFFTRLSQSLKIYNYKTILSVDLFGYVATQYQSSEIGQRISDMKDNFDYISFMLYPSHFYGGFIAQKDEIRELPAAYFPYKNGTDTESVVSSHPYEVVLRSIFTALDFLEKNSTSTTVKIRPWLQDFNLKADTDRGIYYDAKKVKAQIQAAEDSGASGWLLWNASNIYTKEALILE
jgi:hypothetical protein